ncbi:MAG: hypothetical protein JKX92_06040 [Porticoccaceae bacterium]|nr:hypothetical protein [Porticoccaceae bacterium]
MTSYQPIELLLRAFDGDMMIAMKSEKDAKDFSERRIARTQSQAVRESDNEDNDQLPTD